MTDLEFSSFQEHINLPRLSPRSRLFSKKS